MFSLEQLDYLNQISLISFGLAFIAGLVVAFSPSSYPLIPVIMGYVVGKDGAARRNFFRRTLGFVLGIVSVYTVIGILFTAASEATGAVFGPNWSLLLGLVLLFLGLQTLGVFKISLPYRRGAGGEVTSFAGAFLFAVPFVFSLCPYCVPIQLTVLTAASATQQVWYGGLLMFFFGLARAVPLLLAGLLTGVVTRLQVVTRYSKVVERAFGIMFIGLSAYYLYEFYKVTFIL